ncbi:hypothetical protein [Paenibacillus crassostreae]|uniref:Uncharacterized protein n=1 Tax=Paenibacillus crassostreae TaxID=1763538 RepID=A0A167C6M6_9BACL|nr:hypothetical protein [Paenibacillus crassostreae]AOZ91582.1 hypothetical protein LPB68_04705 [Paenibacillus crassostreae]OAB72844.1 hypothetical protein PNBC_15545 [Paenibacillus crassostreae]
MSITIKALLNKQTRDSKKESMTFWVKGEDEDNAELRDLSRSVVNLQIEGVEANVVAEFKKLNRDDKKTTLDFEIKGGTSEESSTAFYKRSGTDVVLTIAKTEESVDDFKEHQKKYREGLKGKVNSDGTVVVVDPNQMTIDEALKKDDDNDPMAGVDPIDSDDDLPF